MGKIEFGAKNCILPVRYDFQNHACDEQLQEKDLRSASSKHIKNRNIPQFIQIALSAWVFR